MSDHIVVLDVKITEFDGGSEVNQASWRMKGDHDYISLVMRLITAMAPLKEDLDGD
jgi:hypothetical protein